MKRTYVATDLKTFINESSNHNNDKTQINEGCSCNKKKRPDRPTETKTKTVQPAATKKGIVGKGKLNESAVLNNKIKKVADEIKNHKFNAILESSCKDSTKVALMVNEGVSKTTAESILTGYSKRVDYINKSIERLNTLNEGFELIDDEMDNCEDYDFKDRRHGQVETGLYDSAPDNGTSSCQEDCDGMDSSLDEEGFDEELEDDTQDEFSEDELGDEFEEDAELGEETQDGDLGDDDLDQVGEEIEIKKFVFGVDDVQGAIEELRNLGIEASEFSDDESMGDELGDSEGEMDNEFGFEEETEDMMGDTSDMEGTTEFEDEEMIGESAKPRKIYEGEIIIDVENWGDDEYDSFTKWLETYDITPEEIFGEDSDVEFKDVEDEDFSQEDTEDFTTDETEDLDGDDFGEESEEDFSDFEEETNEF